MFPKINIVNALPNINKTYNCSFFQYQH